MRYYRYTYGILALIIIALLVYLAVRSTTPPGSRQSSISTSTAQTIGPVTFACAQGKTIQASFSNSPSGTSTVALALSDGRAFTLPQTISADGGRYANAEETFVFWTRGNTAFISEGNQNVSSPAMTYTGCIVLAPDTTGTLTQSYVNGQEGFSLRYPQGYSVDEAYQYQEFGPGKAIGGVKFTIPPSTAYGTNLAPDTYVSVESIPQAQDCSAALFLPNSPPSQSVTDGGVIYSVASTTGAAAGNRYEETVYAIPETTSCLAIRYFVHWGVIENYPQGSVQAFNHTDLINQFDAIRRTLTVGQ